MYLQQLHYLRQIVEKGSFAAAALAAGVSQPAISQAMQTLERAIGLPLFERVGRRRRPTAAALAAAQHGRELSEGMASLKTSPHKAPNRSRGGLRIGMSPGAALTYGPLVVSTWYAIGGRRPIVLSSGPAPEMLRALRHGDLDLVVAPRPRASASELQDLRADLLYSSAPQVYARVDHPLGSARSLTELMDVGWAVVGPENTPGSMIAEAHRVRRLGPAKVLVRCTDYATCVQLVGASDLMAVLPHSALVDPHHCTRIRALRLREGLPQYEVCIFAPDIPLRVEKKGGYIRHRRIARQREQRTAVKHGNPVRCQRRVFHPVIFERRVGRLKNQGHDLRHLARGRLGDRQGARQRQHRRSGRARR